MCIRDRAQVEPSATVHATDSLPLALSPSRVSDVTATLTGAPPSPAVVLVKLAATWLAVRPAYPTLRTSRWDHAPANRSAAARASLSRRTCSPCATKANPPAAPPTTTSPVTTETMMMRLLMALIQPHGPAGCLPALADVRPEPADVWPSWRTFGPDSPAGRGCVAASGHEELHARVAVADFANPPVRHAVACRPGSRDLDRGRASADVIRGGGHPVGPARQCVAGSGRRWRPARCHVHVEQRRAPRGLSGCAVHGRCPPGAEHPALPRADHLRHQPRRGPGHHPGQQPGRAVQQAAAAPVDTAPCHCQRPDPR